MNKLILLIASILSYVSSLSMESSLRSLVETQELNLELKHLRRFGMRVKNAALCAEIEEIFNEFAGVTDP